MTDLQSPAPKLLAIDDDARNLELVVLALNGRRIEVLTAPGAEEGLRLFRAAHPQIVLLDLVMPEQNGMEVLQHIMEVDPATEVIIMSAYYSTESAVEAIQRGAADYLNKPFEVEKLRAVVDRLVSSVEEHRKSLRLQEELLESSQFEGIIGSSPLMRDVFGQIRRAAPHFRTALILGATGAGKELVARALHQLSPAAAGPFVPVNCSAVVDTLFESELFGYKKGAFTGAGQDKIGVFEYADGGTVFLDEIGDMPLRMQAKILRVLQSREVQRVGSPSTRKVNVRVIAATHQNLRAMVEQKLFREDLYYRLSTIVFEIPSLADRRDDLPLLIRYFVERFRKQYRRPIRGITSRAQAALMGYFWPGNVRELENVLDHCCMMTEGETIDVRDLPAQILNHSKRKGGEAEDLISLEESQRRYVARVLERLGGNKVQAAKVLGVSRATLYRLVADTKSNSSKVPHGGKEPAA